MIVVNKRLVAFVNRRVQAFGGICGSSLTSLWWQTLSFIQACGSLRGLSFSSLC